MSHIPATNPAIALADLLARLPPAWPDDPLEAPWARADERKVIVLDDDPTGTQTVHGVAVLTTWERHALTTELLNADRACFILTNSRSLPPGEAADRIAAIAQNLRAAVQQAGRDVVIISRSDSTLRGHFPGETDALAAAWEQPFDATLLIPFFAEGGRVTCEDTHYLRVGERLVPVGATEFARDAAFGYQHSNLRAWVAEKTGGRIPPAAVASLELEAIRRHGPEYVTQRVLALDPQQVCVVNALTPRDLGVVTAGLLAAEQRGRRYLYRTAATFVQQRAGIRPRPLLSAGELDLPPAGGGLIVAGSYVPTTSAQLAALQASGLVACVEVDVAAVLDPARREGVVGRAGEAIERSLAAGRDTLLMTSRAQIRGASARASLAVGQAISAALVQIVRHLSTRPRYLIAKGGITSSDIATHAFAVQRALVIGQIAPGVPVWRLGSESAAPGLAYIVFPGNVGGPDLLRDLVSQLATPGKEA